MNIDTRFDQREALRIVLVLNTALAAGFFATGLAADSSSLIANGLVNVSDALVYALSLFAMGRSAVWKRGAARTSGFMLIGFAVGVALDAIRRVVGCLLAHPGIHHVHVIEGEGSAPEQLCIHYHTGTPVLARVRRLVGQIGAVLGERCGHWLRPPLKRESRHRPPSLLGERVPEFSLPPVQGRAAGLSSDDLVGEVSIVNVFASWGAPCRDEHPLLMHLARRGIVPINAINYTDEPGQAEAWLAELGEPYARTAADVDGHVGTDWGVYGVPDTFVVDADGRVAYQHVGPLSSKRLDGTILPLVVRLQGAAAAREATPVPGGSGEGGGDALADGAAR